jgi:hypothetical protein
MFKTVLIILINDILTLLSGIKRVYSKWTNQFFVSPVKFQKCQLQYFFRQGDDMIKYIKSFFKFTDSVRHKQRWCIIKIVGGGNPGKKTCKCCIFGMVETVYEPIDGGGLWIYPIIQTLISAVVLFCLS